MSYQGGAGSEPGMKVGEWFPCIGAQPPLLLQLPQPAVKLEGMLSHCAPAHAQSMLREAGATMRFSPGLQNAGSESASNPGKRIRFADTMLKISEACDLII